MTCETHDKVYANHILCSDPPRRPWVCRTCGEQGSDVSSLKKQEDEYQDLVNHFRKQKIKTTAEKVMERHKEVFKRMAEEHLFLIVYWNYYTNEVQTERIRAKNKYRAVREFCRKHGRKHEIHTVERL